METTSLACCEFRRLLRRSWVGANGSWRCDLDTLALAVTVVAANPRRLAVKCVLARAGGRRSDGKNKGQTPNMLQKWILRLEESRENPIFSYLPMMLGKISSHPLEGTRRFWLLK